MWWCRDKSFLLFVLGFFLTHVAPAMGSTPQIEELAKLSPRYGLDRSQFGLSVGISGPHILVGTPNYNSGAGRAYLYRYASHSLRWIQEQVLESSGSSQRFGEAVAIEGDTAIVGARRVTGGGGVYSFRRDPQSGSWFRDQFLRANDTAPGDRFGNSVSLHRDLLLVGAPRNGVGGAAYLFQWVNDEWIEIGKLTKDAQAAGDDFGIALSLHGARIAVAAPGEQPAGAVYLFEFANGEWVEAQRVVASQAQPDHGFASSLSVTQDFLLVGSPRANGKGEEQGNATLFEWNSTLSLFEEKQTVAPEEPADNALFGFAVTMNGGKAVITSPGDDFGAGSAYLFSLEANGFQQETKIQHHDPSPEDAFGDAVALDRGFVVVGNSMHSEGDSAPGAAYVFGPEIHSTDAPPLRKFVNNERRVWHVGLDPSADFIEIEDAMDSVQPGDVILVHPDHDYGSFVLDKGIVVRSTEGRFTLNETATIQIQNIPADQTVALSGVLALSNRLIIDARDCLGTVVIEDIEFLSEFLTIPSLPFIRTKDCRLVHASDVIIAGNNFATSGYSNTTFEVIRSDLVLNDSHLVGNSSDYWVERGEDGVAGGSALFLGEHARCVIAFPQFLGGAGQPGGDQGFPSPPAGNGGVGGAGLDASQAESVLLIGRESHSLEGGKGGRGGRDYTSTYVQGEGGNGGIGLIGDAIVSEVSLLGGEGGRGTPGEDGDEGEPYVGKITIASPTFPTLAVPKDLRPGREFDLVITGDIGSSLKIMISNQRDWVDLPGIAGAPLSTVPGSVFIVIDAGTLQSDTLTRTIALKDGLGIVGTVLTFQVFAVDPSNGLITLSNAVTRVVGVN